MGFLFPFSDKILPYGGTVSVLGSTGTIGVNCLKIILDIHSKNRPFCVQSLVAGQNYKLLSQQARIYQPKIIALENKHFYQDLKSELFDYQGEIVCGDEGVLYAASQRADYVMSAIVGTAGLNPTMASAHQGTVIALANKECLVTGGACFLNHIRKQGAFLFPVDSEHNALYMVMKSLDKQDISHYYITASGGAFRDVPLSEFKNITHHQAQTHPNWNMGAKICVDSATMMNKGLELIEAVLLFGLNPKQCDAVLHPQSVVHGMVTNYNGEMHLLASMPDMKIPIWSSLNYGSDTRMQRVFNPFDFQNISFSVIDKARYPLFYLAKNILLMGGYMPAILNAVNEIAVNLLCRNKISFAFMADFVQNSIDKVQNDLKNESFDLSNIADILKIDSLARHITLSNHTFTK